MGSVVISGATSGAVTLAVPAEAGTRTLTLPATTGTVLTNDISTAGDTSAGDAAAVGYTSAEGLILTGQGSTSDVTIKNDADATVLSIPTGTTGVTITSAIDVVGSNFANLEFTGASVNGSGVYTGLDSGGGYVVNVRDAGYIGFSTSNAERARILSGGQLIVAGTSFNANGSVCIGSVGASLNGMTAVSASTSASNMWRFYNPNGHIGSISVANSTCSFTNHSDYRLKENVDYSWDATTRLKQLKPARFNFIADESDTLVDGFIAHEVSSIVPEAITGTKDATKTYTKIVLNAAGALLSDNIEQSDWAAGKAETPPAYPSDSTWEASKVLPDYQGIDQSKLVPLLVKTIQELEARITALEA